MSKPVLAAGLLAVAAGAWYWALLPPAASPFPASIGTAASASAGPVPHVQLERLGAPRRVLPLPGGRDPFHGAGAAARSLPSSVAAAARVPAVAPGPAPPAWPRLELIGVAETRGGAALVRTAIVSGPRGVHHARPGELVEQVYRLERIGADGVDVRLLPEDRLVRLALRP